MKEMYVTTTWRTTQMVEVPDDYEWDGKSLDVEWVEQVDSHTAELVDWEVRS